MASPPHIVPVSARPAAHDAPQPGLRWAPLDALRALAMLWMAGFHFSFDLNLFGWLQPRQNFYADPFWTLQRACIVSLFLFCAGFGQALGGASRAGFWRRWLQVAGCALAVSLGSAVMFPRSWIFFGVLHGIAVMLLLLRGCAAARSTHWQWALALASLLLPSLLRPLQLGVFDQPALQWLGLMTRKPVTEDYVPVLPWFGVMLIGQLVGRHWRQRRGSFTGSWPASGPLAWLATLGRWPLSFYMLHQPVLIGALMLAARLR